MKYGRLCVYSSADCSGGSCSRHSSSSSWRSCSRRSAGLQCSLGWVLQTAGCVLWAGGAGAGAGSCSTAGTAGTYARSQVTLFIVWQTGLGFFFLSSIWIVSVFDGIDCLLVEHIFNHNYRPVMSIWRQLEEGSHIQKQLLTNCIIWFQAQ